MEGLAEFIFEQFEGSFDVHMGTMTHRRQGFVIIWMIHSKEMSSETEGMG